jgi:hypothetical protein
MVVFQYDRGSDDHRIAAFQPVAESVRWSMNDIDKHNQHSALLCETSLSLSVNNFFTEHHGGFTEGQGEELSKARKH